MTSLAHRGWQKLVKLNYWMYDQSLNRFYEDQTDYYNYACMLAKQGQKSLVIQYLKMAIAIDPRFATMAVNDKELQIIWDDEELKQMAADARNSVWTPSKSDKIRLLIFDLALGFVLATSLLLLFRVPYARDIVNYGLLFGLLIEMLEVFVFRKKMFFGVIGTPLILSLIILNIISLIFTDMTAPRVTLVTYIVMVIYSVIFLPCYWIAFNSPLKGFAIYRIQNLAYGVLSVYPFIIAITLSGVWILTSDCSACNTYFLANAAFALAIFLLVKFTLDQRENTYAITLNKAQTILITVTCMYILMLILTYKVYGLFEPESIILLSIQHSGVMVCALVLAISEVYLVNNLVSKERVTRYLIAGFFLWNILANVVAFALDLGILKFKLPAINLPSLNYLVLANMGANILLWLFYVRLRGVKVMGNYISISGVTSSSINVESPFATALTSLEATGQKDMALTLMQLRDVVEAAKFSDITQSKQALEILESIAEESQKPQPKKFSVTSMISILAGLVSSATAISGKAPELIERLRELWK